VVTVVLTRAPGEVGAVMVAVGTAGVTHGRGTDP